MKIKNGWDNKTNFLEINTEQSFEKTIEVVNQSFEPLCIHIREGVLGLALKKEISEKLTKEHGF